nr:AMP-binding protein [Croceicoccus ponticola]
MQRPEGDRLARVLDYWAAKAPDHKAVCYFDSAICYAELQDLSTTAARSLLALGVGRGDRVGVLLGNRPEWIVMSMATSYIGAILVPLNTWYKAYELRWTLGHCGISVLVSADRFLKTDYRALLTAIVPEIENAGTTAIASPEFPHLKSVFFLGEAHGRYRSWMDFLDLAHDVSREDFLLVVNAATGDDTAFILYTSGSTADPKGVMLNGKGVVANGFDLGAARTITSDDLVWLGSPLFYGLGATNAVPATFTRGATLVLQGHFDATMAIDVIERTGSTVYYGTGNMTRAILDDPGFSLARVGTLQKGNAGTVAEYKRMTLVEMGVTGAVPAYGLTESYGNATVGCPDDPLDIKLGTSGRPLPGMEMRIVDPQTGKDLPQGETGLVLLRGYTTPGYFDNPEETAKALRPDGFFDTGDLGCLDGEGRFIFHSRLKEVIKSGGINVSPVEIEQLIAAHPDVRDAYVVGVGHPVKGELVVAFVDPSARLSEDDIQSYVKERAASFKVPQHVFFRSEASLPRLASGKVAKFRLAEEARRELGLNIV